MFCYRPIQNVQQVGAQSSQNDVHSKVVDILGRPPLKLTEQKVSKCDMDLSDNEMGVKKLLHDYGIFKKSKRENG